MGFLTHPQIIILKSANANDRFEGTYKHADVLKAEHFNTHCHTIILH